MAVPTEAQKLSFGPLRAPFETSNKPPEKKIIRDAHKIRDAFEDRIHDARDDGHPAFPPSVAFATLEQIEKLIGNILEGRERRTICYLWVIDDLGIINMLWEGIENLSDLEEKAVKHTNITGGAKAYHGGEAFFCEEGKLYVNNKSDRYGQSEDNHWDAVMSYFKEVYHQFKVVDIRRKI